MAAPLLLLQDVRLTYGTTALLDGAELSVGAGERLALVGRNGSGKSTLLRIAAGLIEADAGTRFAQPGATIRYLPQEPSLAGFATVRDYVEAGLAPGDDAARAFALLGKLGLSGEENPAHLSGGEGRRAALARALAPRPDILLLDEPTNHLDLPAIEWLEAELKSLRSALVLISHDRRFLQTLSRACVWLDRGQTRRLEQGFAAFESWRDTLLEEEERERHKLDRKIAAEEHWVRYGVTARRKRNVRRMAELAELRTARREALKQVGQVKLDAAEASASGTLVVEARQICKAYGDVKIVDDFSIRILRRDRVGIVGPNGAGKTTLIKLLTGLLPPDAGEVKLGANLAMAALDQTRDVLDPEATLADVLTGGHGQTVQVGGQTRHVVSYMKDFLFQPEQARQPMRVLSGGERARLLLAKALATPSNVLVLDEPTNDLDLETLDLLEEMIAAYPGTVLVVSHDRDFLDRVATSVLVAEGEGRFTEYAGGYSDMLAQRGRGFAAEATPRPKAEKPRSENEAPKAKAGAAKLTFKDKHALETLPKEMAALETEIAGLQGALADPALYARDPAAFAAKSAALTAAHEKLAAAEERWLELEILREELARK
ncbi:MAG: ATP-binding cassette domain-containing protein [Alphaproteobacteria bacterium]|nr:ATP-binding cassette domain-containing protein [Alphaproteobacteria bacterium]